MIGEASTRSKIVTRRTYNRPLDNSGKRFESWELTVARVIDHHQWLWERALGRELNKTEWKELYELEKLMIERKV